jgi:hypothetical protein
MFRKALVAALALVAVSVVGSAAQQGDPKTAAEHDFTGKVLTVAVKPPTHGGIVQNARIKRLGGRAFLVGDSIRQANGDEFPQTTYWFPIDDVLLIREFKNVQDALKEQEALMKLVKPQP